MIFESDSNFQHDFLRRISAVYERYEGRSKKFFPCIFLLSVIGSVLKIGMDMYMYIMHSNTIRRNYCVLKPLPDMCITSKVNKNFVSATSTKKILSTPK